MKSLRYYFRYLIRNKVFSFVSILSLAVSMSVIILLSSFIISEFKYDKHIKDVDKIFIIGASNFSPLIPEKAKNLLINSLPDVSSAANYAKMEAAVVYNGENINALIINTDENFFSIFNIRFLAGGYKDIFEDSENVVITRSFSKRIFGTENSIGKIVNLAHTKDVRIAAIIEDFPDNTILSGDVLCSTSLRIKYSADCNDPNDCIYFYNTLIKLNSSNLPAGLTEKLTSIIASTYSNTSNKKEKLSYSLIPYKNAYFETSLIEDDLTHANINLIKLLILLTALLLGLSVFNYITLSLSQISIRFKEFGLKQIIGATSAKIFMQFFAEAFFTMLFAFGVGLLLSSVFEPAFNDILGKQIALKELLHSPVLLICSLLSLILLAFISALYPALVTLKYQPKEILAINKIKPGRSLNIRNVLNLLQYSASIIVITALLVITLQLNFVKHKDLGFSTEYLIRIPIHYSAAGKVDVLKEKIKSIPGVKNICSSLGTPGAILTSRTSPEFGEVSILISNSDFIETFGIHILSGRNFLPQEQNKVCIINKQVLKKAGWSDINGKKMFGREVVGLVDDFYYKDFYNDLGCLMIEKGSSSTHLTARLYPGDVTITLDQMKKAFREILPDYEFNYQFYDAYFDSQYKQEEKRAATIKIIALIAIFITLIGLYGSVEFSTLNRIKEIGIRKVNGAKVFEVMLLLNKSYAKWFVISFIIACPIAYYLLNKWLQNFKYKISLEWWIFVLSGISIILLAMATTSWRTWKTATTNPIKALRYE